MSSTCGFLYGLLIIESVSRVSQTCLPNQGFLQVTRAVMVVIVRQSDLQLPMQSVPISTKVVSLNPVHGKVYSIQHYVMCTPVSSTNKTDHHDITEILLKVVLNARSQTNHRLIHCSNSLNIFLKIYSYLLLVSRRLHDIMTKTTTLG